MPVKPEAAVVSDGEWHRAQPMLLNKFEPLIVDWGGCAGVGGAVSRANSAKFKTSDDISESVPIVVPKFWLFGLPFRMLLVSSGVGLNTQPVTALRSLGNTSFD